jgi:hypothetical protein
MVDARNLMEKMVHDHQTMFLPLGRNTMKGVWMLSPKSWKEYVGRKWKMYEVFEVISSIPMLMLKFVTIKSSVLGHTIEDEKLKSPRDWCREKYKDNDGLKIDMQWIS